MPLGASQRMKSAWARGTVSPMTRQRGEAASDLVSEEPVMEFGSGGPGYPRLSLPSP